MLFSKAISWLLIFWVEKLVASFAAVFLCRSYFPSHDSWWKVLPTRPFLWLSPSSVEKKNTNSQNRESSRSRLLILHAKTCFATALLGSGWYHGEIAWGLVWHAQGRCVRNTWPGKQTRLRLRLGIWVSISLDKPVRRWGNIINITVFSCAWRIVRYVNLSTTSMRTTRLRCGGGGRGIWALSRLLMRVGRG